MDIEDVLDELNDAANELGIVAPDFGSNKGKAYEIWAMLELVVRLMRRGVRAFPSDRNDALELRFRVSGSPADMPASGPSGGPCHFKLQKQQKTLELHLGLNCAGISTATHELDLIAVPFAAGLALRQHGGGPYRDVITAGLELKAYSAEHKLSHDIPRALLGVAVDLDPAWAIPQWTFRTSGGGETTFYRHGRMQLALLTATQLYASSETMLEHHGIGAHAFVLPEQNEAALDAIVDLLDAALT